MVLFHPVRSIFLKKLHFKAIPCNKIDEKIETDAVMKIVAAQLKDVMTIVKPPMVSANPSESGYALLLKRDWGSTDARMTEENVLTGDRHTLVPFSVRKK